MPLTMRRASVVLPFLLLLVTVPACGGDKRATRIEITTETVTYRDGDVELEGYLAYDAARTGKRPGVLVIHEWWGLAEHPKERARALAALGYVAFAPDMYGKGKLTDKAPQASAWANEFRKDPQGFGRRRIRAGYEILAQHPRADATSLGAIGFCYGGTVALELAWSGANVKAVVSFHGQPVAPQADDVAGVKAAALICHGAADGFVPEDVLANFGETMRASGLNWHLISYEGAVHAFTNPGADAYGIDGVKYHEAAARSSWKDMRAFLAEHLHP